MAYTITMYEVTISATRDQAHLLDYVKDSLSLYIRQIEGLETTLEEEFRSYYTLACKDTFRPQLKRNVSECIAKVLSLGCKNIFVRQLLDVYKGNIYQDALINTLCIFDSQCDNKMMSLLVDTDQDIYIDGYYNFRMFDVKRKWQDVIEMVLENDYILADNQLIEEFLRYLLESIDHKIKKLSIVFDNDNFYLYDDANKIIDKSISLSAQTDCEREGVINALCLNPTKIKVYYKQSPSKDFCDLMYALFDVEFLCVR